MKFYQKRPKNKLEDLNNLLDKSLENGFLSFINHQIKVFALWPLAVGPQLAAKTKPDSLKNGWLTVLAPAPAWIERLNYQKPAILKKMNDQLEPEERLQEIVFKVGS